MFKNKTIFEGNISVKAAIFSPYRNVEKLIVDPNKHDKDTSYIIRNAKKQGIEVINLDREEIDEIADGKTHGGLIAVVGARDYQQIEDCDNEDFIALVEGVEDPFNYGFVLRSLFAAGCNTIITTTRNWSNASSVVCKSSAGASEKIKMVINDDLTIPLNYLKEKGFKIICANRSDNSVDMYDYNLNQKVCICIGGEKRGLSKDVKAMSSQDIYIPYNQDFKNALSAASATTILAYEVYRQKRAK